MAGKKKGAAGTDARERFELDEQQRQALVDAIEDDKGDGEPMAVPAFWRAAADRGGFIHSTVQDYDQETGSFTAWPQGSEPDDDEQPDLSESAHHAMLTRLENVAGMVLQDEALVSSVRDIFLQFAKQLELPWHKTPSSRQRDIATNAEHNANELLRRVTEIIVANGREPIRALLTKVTLGDDIVINLKAKPFTPEETDAAVMALHRAHGKHVLITVASTEDYQVEARDAEIDDDEPEIDFEAGDTE